VLTVLRNEFGSSEAVEVAQKPYLARATFSLKYLVVAAWQTVDLNHLILSQIKFPVCRHNRPISARFLGSSALARFDNYTCYSSGTRLTCQDLTGSGSPPGEKMPTGSEYSYSATAF
jgi:hypothetical protein